MGAREVTVTWNGGTSDVVITIEGALEKGESKECSLTDLRKQIQELIAACGLKVKSIKIQKVGKKKKK